MTPPPFFTYDAITEPRTIRLLHLHPGSGNDRISLSIHTASLDANLNYEAISYCWGPPAAPKHLITVNNRPFLISTSLWTGLAHFRPSSTGDGSARRPRILWADAICIDQTDPREKSAQVLLMPAIYSSAARVLIWLGPCRSPSPSSSDNDNDNDDTEPLPPIPPHTPHSIRAALAILPAFDPDDPTALAARSRNLFADAVEARASGQANLLDHDWTPLMAVLRRPWFRRKWVVQEVALAREAVVFAGGGGGGGGGEEGEEEGDGRQGVEIAWEELAELSFRIEAVGAVTMVLEGLGRRYREEAAAGGKGCGVEGGELEALKGAAKAFTKGIHGATTIHMVHMYAGRSTLLDGVMVTASFQCTDPRDHLYALLSLPAEGAAIVPDYDLPVAEVYRRYAVRTMVEGKTLKILSLAPDKQLWSRPGTKRIEGLPSWAPDLTRLGEVEQLVGYTIREQRFFAGGRGDPALTVSDDGRTLACRGKVIDTVKELAVSLIDLLLADMPEARFSSDPPADHSLERKRKRTTRWLQGCYDVAFSNAESPPSSEEVTAFARTMLCDMVGMRDKIPAGLLEMFPGYLEWVRNKEAGRDAQLSPAVLEHVTALEHSMLVMTMGRRFCLTENKRMAHLPLESKTGDLICVLTGGEVPYVIRPAGQGVYTFVGECYADGVMSGETMDDQNAGTPAWDYINLI